MDRYLRGKIGYCKLLLDVKPFHWKVWQSSDWHRGGHYQTLEKTMTITVSCQNT